MTLERSIPQLPSLDLEESKHFYKDKLGFKLLYEDPGIIVLKRDDAALHLWKCEDKNLPANSSCYFNVKGIEDWYKKCSDQKIVHPKAPLEDKPWMMREFIVADPHGNFLKFGEEIKTGHTSLKK